MKTWSTKGGASILRLLSGRCNVFAVLRGGKFILVDTGGKRARRLLLKRLKALLREGWEFAAVVLTHAHFDHAQNAAAVAKAFGAPLLVHESELEYLREGRSPAIRGLLGPTRLLNKIPPGWMDRWFRYTPAECAQPLGDLGNLALLGFEGVLLLYTPGHTPGSVSVVVDGEIALVGDAMHGVFPGNALPPYAQDAEALLTGWRKLLDAGCEVFLPAHGGARSSDWIISSISRVKIPRR